MPRQHAQRYLTTRMDTLKSDWTHYVYYTTRLFPSVFCLILCVQPEFKASILVTTNLGRRQSMRLLISLTVTYRFWPSLWLQISEQVYFFASISLRLWPTTWMTVLWFHFRVFDVFIIMYCYYFLSKTLHELPFSSVYCIRKLNGDYILFFIIFIIFLRRFWMSHCLVSVVQARKKVDNDYMTGFASRVQCVVLLFYLPQCSLFL